MVPGMTLGYPTSDMVLGWMVNVRVRVNSNMAWVWTLWVPSSFLVLLWQWKTSHSSNGHATSAHNGFARRQICRNTSQYTTMTSDFPTRLMLMHGTTLSACCPGIPGAATDVNGRLRMLMATHLRPVHRMMALWCVFRVYDILSFKRVLGSCFIYVGTGTSHSAVAKFDYIIPLHIRGPGP